MRLLGFIILLFTSQHVWSQVVYTSHTTEYNPGNEVEYINRTIMINEETIVIESETPNKTKATQTFYIKEYSQQKIPQQGLTELYECSTKDDLNIITYFLIPVMEKVEFIEVTQLNISNNNIKSHKLLLD